MHVLEVNREEVQKQVLFSLHTYINNKYILYYITGLFNLFLHSLISLIYLLIDCY